MANFIQQFNAGGITYDLHDSEFIIDTRTASGAALTGETKAAALFDGMQITFWMSYAAAANATLNLTLADGTTTGAIPCYYSGTTRLGTHYAAGNAVHFTYRENVTIGSTTVARGWWGDANYSVSDTNYDIFGVSIPIKTRLNAYCLCAMVGTEGTIAKQTNTVGAGTYWQINAFTQSSGTGATKKLVANQGYYPGKIFYHTGSSAITDAGSVSGTISASTNNMDLRYTVNGSSSANIGVTGAPFFLVGSLGSDGLFYPNGHEDEATKEWWQCGFPTDLTSTYVYWFVGMMTSKYQCRLSDHNWMLKSDGTKWIVFDGAKKVHWDNIEGKPTSFTPASHSHGYISNDGSIPAAIAASPASGDKIVITDSSDGDKVRGSITIGSDDGKFLKHDGTWDTPDSGIAALFNMGQESGVTFAYNTDISYADILSAKNNGISIAGSIGSATGYITASAEETFSPPSGQTSTYTYWKFNRSGFGGTSLPGSYTLVGDYYDTTNNTGCKFYIIDGSSEVDIEFPGRLPNTSGETQQYVLSVNSGGSGSWVTPDDHILIMTGTMTGGMDDPITTTTSWADFVSAINNHDRLLLVVQTGVNSFANVDLQFKAGDLESDLDPFAVVIATAVAPRSGGGFSAPIVGMIAEPSNNNVRFRHDTNSIFTAVDAADFAFSVDWIDIDMNPYPTSVPSTDGNYSLNVSNGTTSWTTASGGIQPPGSSGDYYLTDDGAGNTTWMPISGASVQYADSAGSATNADSADHATTAGTADLANSANTASYATTAGTASSADSVPWSGVTNKPYPASAPSTNGKYNLNVSGGTVTWTADTPGSDVPDKPSDTGLYVLNVGSSSAEWDLVPDLPGSSDADGDYVIKKETDGSGYSLSWEKATTTDTTYTLTTGDSNGQIKVTPSVGNAYNVDVKGLGSNAYTSTSYLPTAGGNVTGDITLLKQVSSGAPGDSYGIIFQRGVLTDNYNDWKILDSGGYLHFYERGSGSTSWNDRVYFNTTGGVVATGQVQAASVSAGFALLTTTAVAPASGDKLIIADSSDSSRVKQSTLAFGTSTDTFLRNDGTWATPSISGYIPTSEKGAASGVATLDTNSKVPIVQSNYLYGKCSTAGGTAAKTVTIAGYDESTIANMEGVTVFVAFKNINTASSPTLNVNGAGAHPIVAGTYDDPMAIDKFMSGLHAFTLVKAADNSYYWWVNEGRDTVPEAPTTTGTYLLTINSSGNVSWSAYTPPTAATTGTLSLGATGWSGSGPYSHSVTISGTTANSKIDLQPDSTVLAQMTTDGTTALYIENNNGTLTAWAMGVAPTASLTIQYTKTEVG